MREELEIPITMGLFPVMCIVELSFRPLVEIFPQRHDLEIFGRGLTMSWHFLQ